MSTEVKIALEALSKKLGIDLGEMSTRSKTYFLTDGHYGALPPDDFFDNCIGDTFVCLDNMDAKKILAEVIGIYGKLPLLELARLDFFQANTTFAIAILGMSSDTAPIIEKDIRTIDEIDSQHIQHALPFGKSAGAAANIQMMRAAIECMGFTLPKQKPQPPAPFEKPPGPFQGPNGIGSL